MLGTPRAGPALLRPFLALPRAAIDAYAQARGLAWIDDESNADTDVKRNFLRHEIAPRLAAAFPGYPATLARAAAHQAEAARLADELAAHRRAATRSPPTPRLGTTLDRDALVALAARAPHRARNLLRWFLRQHGLARAVDGAARRDAATSSRTRAPTRACALAHAGAEIGIHRGRIVVHAPAVARVRRSPWHGETARRAAARHARIRAGARRRDSPRAALASGAVTIRSRAGGERIRLGARPAAPRAEAAAAGGRHARTGSATRCRSSCAATRWPPCPASASTSRFAATPAPRASTCAGIRVRRLAPVTSAHRRER